MGLLTNPKTREKLVGIVSNHNNKLCVLSYLAGLGWFLALAYRPFNAGVYFSENALLPGLVDSDFHHEHGATDYLRELRDELRTIRDNDKNKELAYKIPANWFESKFRELGLDTYVQNYSFQYPAGILPGQKFNGQNVYGIMRAPKTASTEALVLSVPYRPPEAEGDKTNAGIALMLAMAKAFRKHTYWAKDIIFLISENDHIGMHAWLSAYHHAKSEYIDAGELLGRSGSIQAAVNLELNSESMSRVSLKLEGLNGQLPNLDLVNTVVRLCRRESILPTIHKKANHYSPESQEGYIHSLKTMLLMMWHQAPGIPTGNHGLFHRYHIEAVTLQGVKMKGARTFGFYQMGKVVEGVFRSLNNLLERFHQSFFFYILPATDRYISIGLYMPPFGLLAAPVLIKALAMWISVSYKPEKAKGNQAGQENKDGEDHKTAPESGDGKDGVPDSGDGKKDEPDSGDGKEGATENEEAESPPGIGSVVPVCIMAGVFGLVAYYGSVHFVATAHPFRMRPGEALLWGALALLLSSCLFPRLMKRKASQKGDTRGVDGQLLKCVALLTEGVVLGAVSVMNISLAFFLAVAWVPIALLVRPVQKRLVNWLQYLLLLIISPLGLLYMASLAHSLMMSVPSSPLEAHFTAWRTTETALLTGLLEAHMLGCWTYSLLTLAVFPNWLMFWALLWANPS